MSFAVSDQLAIYTISESVLNYSMVVLIPFTILAIMTSCSYNMRYYEIYEENMEFPQRENDLFNWVTKDKKNVRDVDQLTTQLLESYLHDPAVSATAPVPSLKKA